MSEARCGERASDRRNGYQSGETAAAVAAVAADRARERWAERGTTPANGPARGRHGQVCKVRCGGAAVELERRPMHMIYSMPLPSDRSRAGTRLS